MHSILVTFKSTASQEEMAGPMSEIAQAMPGVNGLISKTWIGDSEAVGAFYVFTDKASADAYLDGEIIANVKGNPAFSDFVARQFDAVDELSVLNGTNDKPLAAR